MFFVVQGIRYGFKKTSWTLFSSIKIMRSQSSITITAESHLVLKRFRVLLIVIWEPKSRISWTTRLAWLLQSIARSSNMSIKFGSLANGANHSLALMSRQISFQKQTQIILFIKIVTHAIAVNRITKYSTCGFQELGHVLVYVLSYTLVSLQHLRAERVVTTSC
jgi:hypothetical protein